MKYKDKKIGAGPWVKLAPILVTLGNNEGKVRKEPPPDALIMDNLETSLATTLHKAHGNANVSMVKRYIKSTDSTIFDHPAYSLDGPGP